MGDSRGSEELTPCHIQRRVSPTEVKNYECFYNYLEPGSLLASSPPDSFAEAWSAASAERF